MLKQDVRLREDEFITDLSPSEESTEDVVGLREDELGIEYLSPLELDTVIGGLVFRRDPMNRMLDAML